MNKLINNPSIANYFLSHLDNNQYLRAPFLKKGNFYLNPSVRSIRSLAIACKGWQTLIVQYCRSKYPQTPLTARIIEYRQSLLEIAVSRSAIVAGNNRPYLQYPGIFAIIDNLKIQKFLDLQQFMTGHGAYQLIRYYTFSQNIILPSDNLIPLEDIDQNQLLALRNALLLLQNKEHLSFAELDSQLKVFQTQFPNNQKAMNSNSHPESQNLAEKPKPNLEQTNLELESSNNQVLPENSKPDLVQTNLEPEAQSFSPTFKMVVILHVLLAFYSLLRSL